MVTTMLLLAACDIDAVGFPVDTAEGWFVDQDVWEDGDEPGGCAVEHEPNDLATEEGTDYDWVGLLHPDRPLTMCGRLSSTGLRNDGTYKGDYDYVFFELAEETRVHAVVRTEPGAVVDLHVFADDWEAAWGGGPWDGRLAEGFGLVLIVSPEGPAADWELQLWADP